MQSSLIHTAAFMIAREICKLIVLDEENCRIVWGQMYEIVRAGIEDYEKSVGRRAYQLNPFSKN